ncbi:MAG: Histidine utilization repressor, partial [Streptosporangiaceae bacterium]|nr:Histidine utilization repressor [Streptosporangiaceae bacterium]
RAEWARVANDIRTGIYSGRYPAGAALPSMQQMGQDQGISHTLIQRAYEYLDDVEGLVRRERGNATFVLPRRRFLVTITVTWAGEGAMPDPSGHLAVTARAEPAVPRGGLHLTLGDGALAEVEVEAAAVGQAVRIAAELVRDGLAASSRAWDTDGMTLTAGPAA